MESSTHRNRKARCSFCGFHYVVIALLFFGSAFAYILRVSFSVALVAMVNSTKFSPDEAHHNSSCAEHGSTSSSNQSTSWTTDVIVDDNRTVSQIAETYDWDLHTQSYLLASMFYGLTASQMISGLIAQRFGIRWVYGSAMFVSYFLNFMIPLAAGWGATPVMVIRCIQGFLQGGMFPIQSQAVSYWVPVMERSRAYSFLVNGVFVGSFVGMVVSGVLAESVLLGGWPSIFYEFGAAGCLWSVLWMFLVTDSAEQHPCVSDSELNQIFEGEGHKQTKAPVPWKYILTSLPFWSFNIASAGYCFAFFLMMTELPMYFTEVLDFNIRSSGALSAAPYLAQCLVTYVSAHISDVLRKSQKLSITAIRKIMSALGLFGNGLCLLLIAFAGCRKTLIIVLLCLANGIGGFTASGFGMGPVDMSPTFSAILIGISSTIGFVVATLVPYVVACLTSSGQTVENWRNMFIICAVAMFGGGAQYMIFGSAERQLWDYPQSESQECIVSLAEEAVPGNGRLLKRKHP